MVGRDAHLHPLFPWDRTPAAHREALGRQPPARGFDSPRSPLFTPTERRRGLRMLIDREHERIAAWREETRLDPSTARLNQARIRTAEHRIRSLERDIQALLPRQQRLL